MTTDNYRKGCKICWLMTYGVFFIAMAFVAVGGTITVGIGWLLAQAIVAVPLYVVLIPFLKWLPSFHGLVIHHEGECL